MKMYPKKLRKSNFTLLELVVVVAILAIIAGGLLVAFDGLQSTAAKGSATNSIAAVDQAIRAFTTLNGDIPNNLDSLLAADVTDVTSDSEVLFIMGSKLKGKLTPFDMAQDHADALTDAGLDTMLYVDILGNENAAVQQLNAPDDGGNTAFVGPIEQIDIPNRIFDRPRDSSSTSPQNRGRGFEVATDVSNPVMVWNRGTNGINNIKVGAHADDYLLAFGLGNRSTAVVADTDTLNTVQLSSAPFYGDVAKNEYSRFVLLYNVGGLDDGTNFDGRVNRSSLATAKLQAVVDTRGDFLDEEFAEFTGQKR